MKSLLATAAAFAQGEVESQYRNAELGTITIVRPIDGPGTLGGVSGYAVIDPEPDDVYTGPALISSAPGSRATDDGGAELQTLRIRIRIPVDAPLIEFGDVITVDSSPLDPELAGLEFKAIRSLAASVGTSRMVIAEIAEEDHLRGGQ